MSDKSGRSVSPSVSLSFSLLELSCLDGCVGVVVGSLFLVLFCFAALLTFAINATVLPAAN